jgi:hypothetical protein
MGGSTKAEKLLIGPESADYVIRPLPFTSRIGAGGIVVMAYNQARFVQVR